MPKILVIRGGAIGDFILTLPVLSALRTNFPQASLEVLGYPHIARLAVESGLAGAVRSIDARPLAAFFAARGKLDPALQQYFSEFAVIISFLYDPDEIFRTNIARCSRAQFIAAAHRPNEAEALHATEVYLKALERLAVFAADPVPRLTFDAATGASSLTIAVHPGSGSPKKNWAQEKWQILLHELATASPAHILIVGGEAEEDRLERLAATLPPGRATVLRSLSLPDLARRLQTAHLFIGHDSGISHLAAALGVPMLVLWGDTAEHIWRPRGEHVRILRHPGGLKDLSMEEVFTSALELLPVARND